MGCIPSSTATGDFKSHLIHDSVVKPEMNGPVGSEQVTGQGEHVNVSRMSPIRSMNISSETYNLEVLPENNKKLEETVEDVKPNIKEVSEDETLSKMSVSILTQCASSSAEIDISEVTEDIISELFEEKAIKKKVMTGKVVNKEVSIKSLRDSIDFYADKNKKKDRTVSRMGKIPQPILTSNMRLNSNNSSHTKLKRDIMERHRTLMTVNKTSEVPKKNEHYKQTQIKMRSDDEDSLPDSIAKMTAELRRIHGYTQKEDAQKVTKKYPRFNNSNYTSAPVYNKAKQLTPINNAPILTEQDIDQKLKVAEANRKQFLKLRQAGKLKDIKPNPDPSAESDGFSNSDSV